LMHPTQTFDVSYIRLFKLVANTRQQLITILSQELSGVEGIHDIWKQTGRPCIPRLLCSFQQNKNSQLLSRNVSEVESNPDSYASRTKIKSQTPAKSPLTNLQHALEDQVYSIMRKSRLLGSLSSSSLFTVTSSHNFVHVQAAEISRSADTLDLLVKKFPFPALPDSFRSALFPKPPQNTTPLDSSTNSGHMLFRDFLREQIDNLMTGDGRDGLAEGRRGTHVEVPTIKQWAKVCVSVFGYLMSDRSNENNHMVSLAANLDLDMKFSDARCRKVLPVASSAYLDNLPSHYPESVHINQLNQALRVFAMNARGPAYEKYVLQLQDDCNKMWINGRQLCEVRSLKGRHCIYP
ncbi:SMG8, partial [Paramuricea clavata]